MIGTDHIVDIDIQTKQDTPVKDPDQIRDKQELFQTYKFDTLKTINYYAYGVGHFLNDLTASFWFNFSLFFLVTMAETKAASFTFLVGQVVDSICTPLVGYLSDKFNTPFGQRIPWYCIGYVIVSCTFPFIFRCVNYGRVGDLVYYATFAGLFNVGWAFCQISHMSLVPAVSCSKTNRAKLNNYRNTSSFIANFVLLSLVSIFLSTSGSHKQYFFVIALILVGIGSITSIFFLSNFKQVPLTAGCVEQRNYLNSIKNTGNEESSVIEAPQPEQQFRWFDWFKKAQFYFYGFAYVAARLSVNVMITMLPFYVKKMNHSTEHDITISLLILYLSSIITSTKTKTILKKTGAKWILALGFLLSILASLVLEGAGHSSFQTQLLFLATAIIGITQAIIMNSVINFICDIIGSNSSKGGFVFGTYSFMDKISTGVVVYFITSGTQLDSSGFVKILILFLPPLFSLASCLMICLAIPNKTQSILEVKNKNLLEEELV